MGTKSRVKGESLEKRKEKFPRHYYLSWAQVFHYIILGLFNLRQIHKKSSFICSKQPDYSSRKMYYYVLFYIRPIKITDSMVHN